jgi:hypothetical protein
VTIVTESVTNRRIGPFVTVFVTFRRRTSTRRAIPDGHDGETKTACSLYERFRTGLALGHVVKTDGERHQLSNSEPLEVELHADRLIGGAARPTLKKKAPPAARVSAATSVLDRGWGKCGQAVEIAGEIGGGLTFKLTDFDRDI